MYNPAAYNGHFFIGSDYRKKLSGYLGSYLSKNFNREAQYRGFFGGIELKPLNSLNLMLDFEYSKNIDKNQYAGNELEFISPRYIRSRFDQKEFSLTLRASFNLTPDFTIQYYGMPFLSIGRYVDFSYINDPRARELENRVNYYAADQISFNETNNEYLIDERGTGTTEYSFEYPDFNVSDFNSNFVLRWEYRAGSVVYLVWTQNRFEWSNNGSFHMDESVRDLFGIHPHNVFMIKLSYRFGV